MGKKLPSSILLHRSNTAYLHQLKRIFKSWQVEVYEAAVLAELRDKNILDSIPVAVAIVDDTDISGLDFLRSVMHSNNWIQRIMLTPHNDPEIFERAVNKAHINYLIPVPSEASKLEVYFNKALKRYEQITRPFTKLDALSTITEDLIQENEKFRLEATTDSLTKLMNRRSFNQIFERIWQRFKEKRIPFSLALLDIDHFKRVNDTYGHQAGDVVLQKLADILMKNQRVGIDYAFRYGGEEFTIISTNTNEHEMKGYLERLLAIVSETGFFYEGERIAISFSAGVCEAIPDEKAEDMIVRVDATMYKAKEAGRNRVFAYSEMR